MLCDPLALFASGYLDKCFEYNCGANQCSGVRQHAGKEKGEQVTFHEAIKWILDQNVARINGHWKLQSEHCNLCTHINEIILVSLVGWRRKLILQTPRVLWKNLVLINLIKIRNF